MALYDTNGQKKDALTTKHNDLAKLLAAGMSRAGAADVLGCSESTITRMMRTPGMRALVDSWRESNINGIVGALVPAALRSVAYLEQVRDNPDAAEYVRVQAAKELLQSVARLGKPLPSPVELTDEQVKELFFAEVERIHARNNGKGEAS